MKISDLFEMPQLINKELDIPKRNVKDVDLWSSDLSKQHVLFVAKPD